MKFFIDTASLSQIKEAQDLGVLDGVTTNPSLMAKEGISGEERGRWVLGLKIVDNCRGIAQRIITVAEGGNFSERADGAKFRIIRAGYDRP